MIAEGFLHYIWNFKLFTSYDLKTTNNEQLQILKSGQHNTDAGPDFFYAQLKINKTLWVGNVEIHVKSSDWVRHQHQDDAAYDNVVLHVVYYHDMEIKTSKGMIVPTLELKNIIDERLIDRYNSLIKSRSWIPCANQLKDLDSFVLNNWMDRLVVERLEKKSIDIKNSLEKNKNNWEETFYQQLFKYFGLKVNAEPFFMLAKNCPLKIIEKHHSVFTIEAFLYGQAGLLTTKVDNDYIKKLQKEYDFLVSKFDLVPFDKSLWKFLRLRPANFPTIRISQLAQLLFKHPRLFSKIMELDTVDDMRKLFKLQASNYWNTHYLFNEKESVSRIKKTGNVLIDTLIINVVVPFLFVYGDSINDDKIKERAINVLQQISVESNNIIDNFESLGITCKSALHSQALIELKTSYCSQKKCLNCSIGNNLLKIKVE